MCAEIPIVSASTVLPRPRRRLGLVAWLLLLPIRAYKAFLSPLLPPLCRFHPSCSVYAMGAISVHGPLRGTALAVRRLLRCHPFHPGGIDPVPPKDGQSAAMYLTSMDSNLGRRLITDLSELNPHLEKLNHPES